MAISSASGASSAVAWCSDDKKKPLTEFKLPDGFPKLPDGIALPFALPELTKEAALPMATSVGFGTLTGFSCGYSLKKVGQIIDSLDKNSGHVPISKTNKSDH